MRPSTRIRLENTCCWLVLVVAAVLMTLPTWVFDAVPADLTTVFTWAPWEDAMPEGVAQSDHAESNLAAQRFFPWYARISAADSIDDLIWNPDSGTGMPFFAVWRTRCLSPFTIPFYVLEPVRALQLSVFLKVLFAGFAAMYAARRFGYRIQNALVVALMYQTSAWYMRWPAYPEADVLVFLPVFALFVERLALGQFRVWPVGAVLLGLMLLGGAPEAVGGILLFGVILLFTRRFLSSFGSQHLPGSISFFLLATAAGIALAGIQIIPSWEFLALAADHGRPPAGSLPGIGFPADLLTPLLNSSSSSYRVWPGAFLFAGAAVPVLLVLGFALRPFGHEDLRHRIEAFLIAVLIPTCAGALAYPLLKEVPILDQLNPEHYMVAWVWVVALCIGATLEEWDMLKVESCAHTLRRFAFALPPVLLLIAGAIGWRIHWAESGPVPYLLQLIVPALAVIATIGLVVFTSVRPSVRIMGYGTAAIMVIAAGAIWVVDVPWTPRDQVFPETDFIKAFRADGHRVVGGEALANWPLMVHGIPQLHVPGGMRTKRLDAFLEALRAKPLMVRRLGSRQLVLGQDDLQGSFAHVRSELNIREVFPTGVVLFDDEEAQPRVRLVSEVRPIDTFDPELIDPRKPPLLERGLPPATGAPSPGEASLVETDSVTRLVIELTSTEESLLVLADAWYPGWFASVDGEPAEVYPVDGLFRGVILPKGAKRVVFEYRPFSIRLGVMVTAGAGIVVGVGLMVMAFRSLRVRKRYV